MILPEPAAMKNLIAKFWGLRSFSSDIYGRFLHYYDNLK